MDGTGEGGYNPAMDEPLSDLHSLVTRFREMREDAWTFEEQDQLLAAARALLHFKPYRDWSADDTRDFIFACSLDMDEDLVARLGLEGVRVEELTQARSRLLALASQSLETGTRHCRWQFAQILRGAGALDEELESLLVRFAVDEDEYVRRLAVDSLGQLQSPLSEEFALRLWHGDDPNQQHSRMMALSVLQKIGSQRLGQLAEEAANGELPILASHARAMLPPVPTIPIARLSPREPLGLEGVALRFGAWLSEKECLIFPKLMRLEEETLSVYADVWLNTFVRWPGVPRDLVNPSHQVRLTDLQLDVREVAYFCGQARSWLELPLAEIARLHFEREFSLGIGGSQF